MTLLTIDAGSARITLDLQQDSQTYSYVPRPNTPVSPPERNPVPEIENRPRFTRFNAAGEALPAGSTEPHVAVLDTTTGLMWAVESLGDETDPDNGIAQDHAIQRCKDLRLLGHEDWSLPTRAELVTLIDDTRHEPAIDTSAFPGVKPRWHWTSTPCAWSSASAWFVCFCYGYVHSARRYYNGFALAVRRAGQ